MRNRYRKAKKFKLDDDYEVVDRWSGHSKNVGDGDGYWGRYTGGLYGKYPNINRWLESRVGRKWDDVFSEFIRFTKTQSPFVADWLRRSRLTGNVWLNTFMKEGAVYANCRWGDAREMSNGDLYVHPETRTLCRAASKVKRTKYWYNYRQPSDYIEGEVEFGNLKFWPSTIKYKRKVATGVFEDVVHKVWRRKRTKLKWGVSHYIDADGNVVNYYRSWEDNKPVYGTVAEVFMETASKKDIRKYKLNKEKE